MKVKYMIAFLLVVLILVLVLGITMIGSDNKKKDNTMYFWVDEGANINDTNGGFFVIRAEKNVNINPVNYSFYVAEKGKEPHRLDFDIRTYENGDIPSGGDRNGTYDYTTDGNNLWNDGEIIAFDMPMKHRGIEIKSGNIYVVSIKDPEGELTYRDTFIYGRQKFPCGD